MESLKNVNLTKKTFANCIGKYINNNLGKHHYDLNKSFAIAVIWRGISSQSDIVYMRVRMLVKAFMASYNIDGKTSGEILDIMDFFRENMKERRKKKVLGNER